MGADGQPQIHLQVYIALIDYGLDIQQAVEAPRWLAGRFAIGDARETLHLEGRFAGGHGRGAGTPRPRDQPVGGVERARRPRPRHHHRPRQRACWWAAPIRAATAPRSATEPPPGLAALERLIALVALGGTYLGLALGRLPFLRVDRTGVAIIGGGSWW